MNNAVIGKNCLIGANTLIPEGKVIPDGSMVLGSPGKVVKTLSPEQQAGLKKSASWVRNKKLKLHCYFEALDRPPRRSWPPVIQPSVSPTLLISNVI